MRKQRQRAEVIYSDTACVIIYLKIFQRNRQHVVCMCNLGFPNGSDSKESACSAKDLGLILGSGRSPGEGNGYPLQYSCLGNPMDREAWWATAHGVTKESDMTKGLSNKKSKSVKLSRVRY